MATILPQNFLPLTDGDSYQMCLGNFINTDYFTEYTEYFKKQGKNESVFLIIDNGAVECDCINIHELVDRAITVHANELIIPDIMYDPLKTLFQVEQTIAYLQDFEHNTGISWESLNINLMGVPQGKTEEEWLNCAKIMSRYPQIKTLGIPKHIIWWTNSHGRYQLIDQLAASNWTPKELHLLGCWSSPMEVIWTQMKIDKGECPEIRGVDSSIAAVYAKLGKRLDEMDRPEDTNVGASLEFEKETFPDISLLQKNIKYWQNIGNMEDVEFNWIEDPWK